MVNAPIGGLGPASGRRGGDCARQWNRTPRWGSCTANLAGGLCASRETRQVWMSLSPSYRDKCTVAVRHLRMSATAVRVVARAGADERTPVRREAGGRSARYPAGAQRTHLILEAMT